MALPGGAFTPYPYKLHPKNFLALGMNMHLVHPLSTPMCPLSPKYFQTQLNMFHDFSRTFKDQRVPCTVYVRCSIYGGELFDRAISEDFLLTEKACVCIMRQICEGVEFIHSRGIIHLDMKVRALRRRQSSIIVVVSCFFTSSAFRATFS